MAAIVHYGALRVSTPTAMAYLWELRVSDAINKYRPCYLTAMVHSGRLRVTPPPPPFWEK